VDWCPLPLQGLGEGRNPWMEIYVVGGRAHGRGQHGLHGEQGQHGLHGLHGEQGQHGAGPLTGGEQFHGGPLHGKHGGLWR